MAEPESDHIRLILIEGEVRELRGAVEAQTRATNDLLDAWKSAKAMLAFLVFLAKVATALGVLWLWIKGIRTWMQP